MPIEENWFNKNTPAQLYGLLQSGAEFDQKEKKLFFSKSELNLAIKEFKKYLGITAKRNDGFNLKVKKLLESGYLSEDDNNYYFPFEEKNLYFLIPKDVLSDLSKRTNDYVIKIYVYLAFKSKAIPNYKFTASELALLMGYSSIGGKNREGIIKALTTLQVLGYLDYDVTNVKLKNGKAVPNFYIKNISLSIPKKLIRKDRVVQKASAIEYGLSVKEKNIFDF